VQVIVMDYLAALGRYVSFVLEVLIAILRRPPSWKLVREQLYSIGVLSIPVVATTGFATGLVLAAQSFYQLSDKGLAGATGLMVTKALFTEMGPVLTGFVITGRIGSAMCAELGSMRVTEQIDALRSMSVNPLRYLVAPRFIAGTIMMPILTVFSNAIGIYGAYLISVYYFEMQPTSFYDPISQHISHFDFYTGVVKSLIFGVMIITICCYKGVNTFGGASGVGKATTNSVVICYSCILIGNFILTVAMNILRITMRKWL
jgi:phospholipid/cholesterol/gamma-HCH transport system permease protein